MEFDPITRRALLPSSNTSPIKLKRNQIELDPDAERFKMEATLGDEDIISTLPDDCLITIMSNLSRDDLDIMDQVSQKFHYISRHPGWTKPRKTMSAFAIQKTSDGHMVCVKPMRFKDDCLVYEITETSERKMKMLKSSYVLYNLYSQNEGDERAIPNTIFTALTQLNLKHSADHLEIFWCHLDSAFTQNIISAFQGKVPPSLTMDGVTIDGGFDFSSFIAEAEIHQLTIVRANVNVQNLIDQQFIRMLSRIANPELNVYSQPELGNKWMPSVQFLRDICRFKFIRLDTISINRAILKELIMVTPSVELSS
ncbi:hypothetical protein PMAYCL1PPCAC_27633 [Pristionchus mayeri]|uniref:F-box domain-containing protein n=1 Tax=Pristionchus mayeri TaxID=1317129 RepID=A0AAN5D628_9BILA|nr:hypothetical protein PMAYCL1PPCAC_27633 [Pristionchus mayeri]